MGLKLRLAPVLAVCVFVLCIFGGVALHTLNEVKINGSHYLEIVKYKDLIADILPPPAYIIESYLVAFQMADEKDPAKRSALIARMKVLSKEYNERHEFWIQDLEASPMKDEMVVKSYKPAKEFYEIVAKDFIPAVERQDREAVYSHLGKLGALYEEHRQSIDRVVKAADDNLKNVEASSAAVMKRAFWTLLLIAVGGIVLMPAVSGFLLERIAVKPIRKVADAINGGAREMSRVAGEVSGVNRNLASGAAEQSAAIEETSASLEEMSSMTMRNADNAALADTLMKDSRNMLKRANTSMGQLTTSIVEISKTGEETSKIIRTIDEIAFQTNLLALNAAVEAARAGEAGAGFAVVADEVRNLAMRAAEAARNTSGMIEDMVKKIKDGSHLVDQTNEAFSDVIKSTDKVEGLVSEIAAASGEQAQGIGHISKAVDEMDKVTQQNAANAEESTLAVEEMSAQAEQLKDISVALANIVTGNANGKGRAGRTDRRHTDVPDRKNSLIKRDAAAAS